MPPPRCGSLIVEPFAGSAGYSLRYGADREVLLVDLDPVIVMVWDYLIKAHPDELLDMPDIDPDATVDDYGMSEAQRALVGFWLNKGTPHPCKRPSSWARRYPERRGWSEKTRARLAAQVPRIRKWRVVHGDYTNADVGDADYHIDPPYQKAGRRYRCGSTNVCYNSLAEGCAALQGRVHVCEAAGADWLPFEPFRKTKASTRDGARFSLEVLWRNEMPTQTRFNLTK